MAVLTGGARQRLDDLQADTGCKFVALSAETKEFCATIFANGVGFPERYVGAKFGDSRGIEPKYRKGWLETDKALRLLSGGELPHPSVYLFGPVGTGKTMYLSALVKNWFLSRANESEYVAYHGFSTQINRAAFITHGELIKAVHATYAKEAGSGVYLKRIYDCELLCLDDFGTKGDSAHNVEVVEELVDYRYSRNLTILISSNVSAPDLKQRAGWERTYSRLSDPKYCHYHELNWNDRRPM